MGQEDVGLIHRTKSYTKMKITPEEKKIFESLQNIDTKEKKSPWEKFKSLFKK